MVGSSVFESLEEGPSTLESVAWRWGLWWSQRVELAKSCEILARIGSAEWKSKNSCNEKFEVFDAAGRDSQFSRPPGFPSASGGLVSTADDYLAFARMMLNQGEYGGRRLLSERSVQLMTTDHITPQQKAVSAFTPGFWDKFGWGHALSIVHRHEPGGPRGFGWDGGYGTSCYWDPETGLIGILLTQRLMGSPVAPPVFVDFWRSAYEALAA